MAISRGVTDRERAPFDGLNLTTPKASHLWLSAIEDLPPRSVAVFTTNAPERFPDRSLDRCERMEFAADGAMLALDAQALVDRIWRAETGRDDASRVGSLNVMDRDNRISSRRCIAALDPMVRDAAKRRAAMPSAPAPDRPKQTCVECPPRRVQGEGNSGPTSLPNTSGSSTCRSSSRGRASTPGYPAVIEHPRRSSSRRYIDSPAAVGAIDATNRRASVHG